MNFWPHYVLLGVGIGFVMALVLHSLRLALRFLAIVGKAAIVLFLLLLVGWIVGFWELPRPLAVLLSGLSRLWKPFHEGILEYIRSRLR